MMGKAKARRNEKKRRGKKSKLKSLQKGVFSGLAFCLVLGVLAGYDSAGKKRKSRVFDFVADEEEALRKAAENADSVDFVSAIDSIGTLEVSAEGESLDIERESGGVITFRCGSEAVSSASCEWGFYYSPKDTPVNFYDAACDAALMEDGNGYAFSGSYDFYTEKICDNFWYYRISD